MSDNKESCVRLVGLKYYPLSLLQEIKKCLYNNFNKLVCIIILILLLLGINNRFIQDDAFISFRYAQHLVEGHGLTWNIGEFIPVEGYTNFLWVIMISFGEALRLDPVLWSMMLGISFGAKTLFITYRLSLMLLKSKALALLTIVLLGTNYSFSSYMTGGLETQLQTFFIVAAAYYSFSLVNGHGCSGLFSIAGLSLLFSLAIMTRPDSVLICGVLYLYVFFKFIKNEHSIKICILKLSILTFSGGIVIGLWLVFKFIYYGSIYPNTYYIKAIGFSIETLKYGLLYFFVFLINYCIIFFIFLWMFHFKKIFCQIEFQIIMIIISLWFLYIIKVGGDFMEFRFFVPMLPFIFLLISKNISILNSKISQLFFVMILPISSFIHSVEFEGYNQIESINSLNGHIVNKNQNWKGVGIVLNKIFGESIDPVIIGTHAAGAIPYYSKLPTVDMLGLNDRWIARNGTVIGVRPGHTRYTTLDYLLESNVNLVVGHPKVELSHVLPNCDPYEFFPINKLLLPNTSKIIEIPLDDNYKIVVLYLKQHKHIDEKIKILDLKMYDVCK